MRKFTAISFIAACIMIAGCQQEISDIFNQVQQCRITTSNYYGGGGMNDSATYHYDASGKLIKVDNQDGYYSYFYSGDRIVKRTFHEHGTNELWWVDSVYYSSGQTIAELVQYDYSGIWGDTTVFKTIFHYQNGKLDRLDIVESYTLWGVPVSDTLPVSVHWNGAGNMEKLVYYDGTQPLDSIQYQFDTHPNYFKMVHPNFFLLEPQFGLYVGLEPHFPYFYSANNVTNSNMYGSFDNPIDYGLDTLNNMTTVEMGGFPYISYKYSCQ